MMKNHKLQLMPRDLLFLRDARPMSASDAGCGANWPRPDQLWNALIHLFHRLWPERQAWEGLEHRKNEREIQGLRHSSDRFGALKSCGPFPLFQGQAYFPCPLDLTRCEDDGLLYPMRLHDNRRTDLAAQLPYSLAASVRSKSSLPQWLSQDEYERYLSGQSFRVKHEPLYDVERNVGNAIDPESGGVIEGRLYQAEYLRLRADVALAFEVSCQIKPKGAGPRELQDVFDKLNLPKNLIIGGQQGIAELHQADWQLPGLKMPSRQELTAPFRLRWTLLSPALFLALPANEKNPQGHPGGWLPSWINPQDGSVQLPKPSQDEARRPDENRRQWRQRRSLAAKIGARMIACRVGKPLYFSGWDLHQKSACGQMLGQGPKPTVAALPPGSAFVFECDNADELLALWQTLNARESGEAELQRRSSAFGEKGFGIGLCSLFNE
ncbi:MAG: hypothetical protein GX901_09980 [Lentisphaerae bacterium]|nr:hypothetical protein [Lentisphaerota bacterium]